MTKRLTRTEEKDLIRRWQSGDEMAGERIFAAFDNYLHGWARSYEKYGPDHDDLHQVARIGVMQALKRFDTKQEVRFSTYARSWVRAELDMFVVANSGHVKYGLSRYMKQLFFGLRKQIFLIKRERPHITEAELISALSVKMRIPEKIIVRGMGVLLSSPIELDRQTHEGEGGAVGDFLQDDGPTPEQNAIATLDAEHLSETLKRALTVLDEREQTIIRGRIMCEDKRTLDDLAQELGGLSKERVRQLESRALGKLRKHLKGNAVFEEFA